MLDCNIKSGLVYRGQVKVAKHLKVKESWVYEKVHTREMPFKKIGKFPRFRKRDIDIWVDNPYHPDLSHYNLNRGVKCQKNIK